MSSTGRIEVTSMLMTLSGPSTRAWSHLDARLPDGGAVVLRPLRPGETEALEAVFDGLSPRSRRQRYLTSMPRLPGYARRVLANVDARDHVAWLALVAGRPAGICRYVRTGRDTAELAFEVVDAEQGRGVGSVLVDAVTTVARASGVEWLEVVVEPDNAASVVLLTRLGIRLHLNDGLLEGRGRLRPLDPPSGVDRGAVRAAAIQHAGAIEDDEVAGGSGHEASKPREARDAELAPT
ncbi:GNAT family N-acetyltransferase [Nocardioides sp. LHG3406-4]|uniref:GNAT family N-acetyltransferase n=1 Tax=Nocardioides sp. LHG3406-4 TaxID=2804575 RepID=UPI003CEB5B23